MTMNQKKFWVLVLALTLSVAPGAFAQMNTNLLTNGDFEDGTAVETFGAQPDVSADPTNSVASGLTGWQIRTDQDLGDCPTAAPPALTATAGAAQGGSYGLDLSPLGWGSRDGAGDCADAADAQHSSVVASPTHITLIHSQFDSITPAEFLAAGATSVTWSGIVDVTDLQFTAPFSEEDAYQFIHMFMFQYDANGALLNYDNAVANGYMQVLGTNGDDGVTAFDFNTTLEEDVQDIHLEIRMYGGAFFSGGAGSLTFDDMDYHFNGTVVVGDGLIKSVPPAGLIEEGDHVVLSAPAGGSDYQWNQDGVDILDGTSNTLVFDLVTAGDAGVYTVTYNAIEKAVVTSPEYTLEVLAAGTLPVATFVGLGALALALAGAGLTRTRRKR